MLITIFTSIFVTNIGMSSPGTVIDTDPLPCTAPASTSFDLNITITDVVDLYGWEFNLTFDPTVLNVTGIVEGPFLSDFAALDPWIYSIFLGASMDNTAGWVSAGCALFDTFPPTDPDGADGDGVLATVTFNVLSDGISDLHFDYTLIHLMDPVDLIPVPIPHTTEDGFFSNVIDVAVIDVLPAKNEAYPTWTIPLNITVTVMNNAPTPKNFTVRAYYENVIGAYEIGIQNVTNLTSGSQLNLTFSWNLTDVAWGLYTIKANVTLAGDINPANNEFVYSNVTIKIPGDICGDTSGSTPDGDVDWFDFGDFAAAYGSHYGQPRYNVESDLDRNGDVDWFDFGDFAAHYGMSTSAYP
jgi:hypothetical protein